MDFNAKRICGELKIKALAYRSQDVTTFFDAEIIQTADDFITQRWEANQDTDVLHWVLPVNSILVTN